MRVRELLFGTTNAGKAREVEAYLAPLGVRVLGGGDVAIPEVVEDQPDFLGNAAKKATEIARATGRVVLADDTGLVVPALGGEPGVRSARYSDPGATPARNNARLLERLRGRIRAERAAYFECVFVLADPDRVLLTARGRCDGEILETPRGVGGFGYDPLFFLPALGRTLAELTTAEKNAVSHRGAALAELVAGLGAGASA